MANTRSLSKSAKEFLRRAKSDDAFYIRNILKVINENGQVVPFKLFPVQHRYMQARTHRDIGLKSRRMGMTTIGCALSYKHTTSNHNYNAISMAHDGRTTELMNTIVNSFHRHMPKGYAIPKTIDNTKKIVYKSGSEHSFITGGSPEAGRGYRTNFFHGCEVAFWTYAEQIIAGAVASVPQDGYVLLETTANGKVGWVYEEVMKWLHNPDDSVYTVHFYPWWERPENQVKASRNEKLHYDITVEEKEFMEYHGIVLTIEQVKWWRINKKALGRKFDQEHPSDIHTAFLASGMGYFSTIPNLADVFTARVRQYRKEGHRYVAGLDIGQVDDYSVLSIVDLTTFEEVKLWRMNNISFQQLCEEVAKWCDIFNVEKLKVETNFEGRSTAETLRNMGVKAFPQATSIQSKNRMITGLYAAMETEGLKLQPDPIGRAEIDTFMTKQTKTGLWTYGHAKGAHDDTVMARALAVDAAMTPTMGQMIVADGKSA